MTRDQTLSEEEIRELAGGYKRADRQLAALHARGYLRAWRSSLTGKVVLERAHVEAVDRQQEEKRLAARLADAIPAPQRQYEGSGLQRYHQSQREAAAEREAIRAENAPAVERQRQAYEAARPLRRAGLVRFHAAKRRCARLQRTPGWANLDAIRAVYEEARRRTVETGIPHHVDHTIPLQGETISGLHVESNLQILTGSENSRKRNRWEP